MAERRRYTKTQKAEAVAAATLTSVLGAAKARGIPRETLRDWIDQPEYASLRHKTRDEVADQMWTGIQVGLREVIAGLSGDAPLRDKSVALGILYDKHALLTGGATARSENRDLTGTLSDADITDAIRVASDLVAAGGTHSPEPDPPTG